MNKDQILNSLSTLTPEEYKHWHDLGVQYETHRVWSPLPGPQKMAYDSEATIIGYGGAAGGGATDLACGKALTQHYKSAIFRRMSTELTGILGRLEELIGDNRKGYNEKNKIWRLPAGREIKFGGMPHSGNEYKYRNYRYDLLVFDEATRFLEVQIRFLMTLLHSTDPRVKRCQVVMTFHPPQSEKERWIIPFFGPWLDPKHRNPAKSGELRWFAMVDGREIEYPSGEPFDHKDKRITPQSRTFIRSRLEDNLYLSGTNYISTLQAHPEPLRSQMLHGDFQIGFKDSEY